MGGGLWKNMRPKKITSKSERCYLNLLKDERAHDEKELCTTPSLCIAFWHWVEEIQNHLFHSNSTKVFTFAIFRVKVLAGEVTWRGDIVKEGKRTDGFVVCFCISSLISLLVLIPPCHQIPHGASPILIQGCNLNVGSSLSRLGDTSFCPAKSRIEKQ